MRNRCRVALGGLLRFSGMHVERVPAPTEGLPMDLRGARGRVRRCLAGASARASEGSFALHAAASIAQCHRANERSRHSFESASSPTCPPSAGCCIGTERAKRSRGAITHVPTVPEPGFPSVGIISREAVKGGMPSPRATSIEAVRPLAKWTCTSLSDLGTRIGWRSEYTGRSGLTRLRRAGSLACKEMAFLLEPPAA